MNISSTIISLFLLTSQYFSLKIVKENWSLLALISYVTVLEQLFTIKLQWLSSILDMNLLFRVSVVKPNKYFHIFALIANFTYESANMNFLIDREISKYYYAIVSESLTKNWFSGSRNVFENIRAQTSFLAALHVSAKYNSISVAKSVFNAV